MRFVVLCALLLSLVSLGLAARVGEDLDLDVSSFLDEDADAAAPRDGAAYDASRLTDLDLDLYDARALASLDFRDPGPPSASQAAAAAAAALLEDHSAAEDYAESEMHRAHVAARARRPAPSRAESAASALAAASARLSPDGRAALQASHAALLATHEADAAADSHLEALLAAADVDDASWARHASLPASLLDAGAHAASNKADPSNPEPDIYQRTAQASATAIANSVAAADQARMAQVAAIAAQPTAPTGNTLQDQLGKTASGKNKTLDLKVTEVRKQLDEDKSAPLYPAMDRILNRVDKIVKTYGQLDRDVQASRITPAVINPDAMQTKADRKVDLYNQVAPTAKDIIDCTACRFTWMQIEVDLGNAVDPVALYDAFVHHCSEMQLTNIFKHPCNAMFANIDKMIGDYIASMSVNQLCMHAGLCR